MRCAFVFAAWLIGGIIHFVVVEAVQFVEGVCGLPILESLWHRMVLLWV